MYYTAGLAISAMLFPLHSHVFGGCAIDRAAPRLAGNAYAGYSRRLRPYLVLNADQQGNIVSVAEVIKVAYAHLFNK